MPINSTRVEILDHAHALMVREIGWTLHDLGHRVPAAEIALLVAPGTFAGCAQAIALGTRAVDTMDVTALRMTLRRVQDHCETLWPHTEVTDESDGDTAMLDDLRNHEQIQRLIRTLVANDVDGHLVVATEILRDHQTLLAQF